MTVLDRGFQKDRYFLMHSIHKVDTCLQWRCAFTIISGLRLKGISGSGDENEIPNQVLSCCIGMHVVVQFCPWFKF